MLDFKKEANRASRSMLFTMLLFCVGALLFPADKVVGWFFEGETPESWLFFARALSRFLFGGLLIWFIKSFDFTPIKWSKDGLIVLIPCLLIALNNFPTIAWFRGEAEITAGIWQIIAFALYCLSIGFFEELAFRGIVLPLVLMSCKKTHRAFYTVVISSAIFGGVHLFNLFAGAGFGGVVLQMGYSFLIGAMCAIVMLRTGNIVWAVLVHAVYDFAGMIVDECGHCDFQNWWCVEQIVLTAALAVVVILVMIKVLLKMEKSDSYMQIVRRVYMKENKNTLNKQLFKQPSVEYRGAPFWAWNGKLDKAELIRQIHVLKEMGFGGFFMHSRTGLVTEYLSDEWFDLIKACSEEADKLGMRAYIYDEDRWPSGSCGGMVTENPKYRCKFISAYYNEEDVQKEITQFGAKFLSAFQIKLDGKQKLSEYSPLGLGEKPTKGYSAIYFVFGPPKGHSFFNGYTYLDTLSEEATEEFLRLTHEKYKQTCGDMFGKKIIGVFTDEPFRGAIFSGVNLMGNPNCRDMVVATEKVFERFSEKCGYDLMERLPELWYYLSGKDDNSVMYDYIGVTTDMFIDNFAKPYYKWCKENKLILTGHILHENSLSMQTASSSDVQRYYEFMDYPGIDILEEHQPLYWVAKQLQSVARQTDKPFTLSELYGCTGWQMNFESYYNVGIWQTIFGINLRCQHLSWYTMEGEAKRDYPASIFYQSTYYKDFSYLEDIFSRLNYLLSQGSSVCDTLLVNPIESTWLKVRKGWAEGFTNRDERIDLLEKHYEKIFMFFANNLIDFDIGNEEIMANHAQIVTEEGKTLLKVGSMKYSKVIVSGADTLRGTTFELLKEFKKKGGNVVICGFEPNKIDGREADLSGSGFEKIPFEEKAICDYCLSNKSVVSYKERMKNSACMLKKLDDGYLLAILNLDIEKGDEEVLQFDKAYSLTELYAESGEEKVVSEKNENFSVKLFAGQCRVFVLSEKDLPFKEEKEEIASTVILDKPMNYSLDEDNALPLDMPEYSVNGEEYSAPTEILKTDREIRKRFGIPFRSGEMIQPWYRNKFLGASKNEKICDLKLKYSFVVSAIPERISLVMEQSEKYTVSLNGSPLAIVVSGHFIDDCYDIIEIPQNKLKTGKNEIELSCEFTENLNLECLYLIGNFGVDAESYAIINLPEKLSCGDINKQGLPFYSGKVLFDSGFKADGQKLKVAFKACYGALTKVVSDDSDYVAALPPYETKSFIARGNIKIELVLTRRNLFGPLHINPARVGAYGPGTFLSVGNNFTERYSLIEQGLLDAPEIVVYKQ